MLKNPPGAQLNQFANANDPRPKIGRFIESDASAFTIVGGGMLQVARPIDADLEEWRRRQRQLEDSQR